MKLISRKNIKTIDGNIVTKLTVKRRVFWIFSVIEKYVIVSGMEEYPNWFRLNPFEEVLDNLNYKLFDINAQMTVQEIRTESLRKENKRLNLRFESARNMFENAGVFNDW